jgi:hypothetical protein
MDPLSTWPGRPEVRVSGGPPDLTVGLRPFRLQVRSRSPLIGVVLISGPATKTNGYEQSGMGSGRVELKLAAERHTSSNAVGAYK